MASKRKKMPPMEFVRCPECGNEQPDMGRGVACEACGFGPMPVPPQQEP